MLAYAHARNRRRGPALAGGLAAVAVAAIALLVLALPPASAARPAATRFTGVTAIYQSNTTFPGSRFIVQVQVADPSAVTFSYFTFCQLTSSVCYLPDVLHHTTGNWFVGNTSQMSQYHGMVAGVRAGYNISIDYANGTNVTEPSLPNQFTGLNVSATVAYQFEYTMIVSPVVFALTGVIHDATTGAVLPGATIEISPGNTTTTSSGSGAYSFSNLTNGSYSLTVTAAGYPKFEQSVQIAGQDRTQDLVVTATPTHPIRSPPPSGVPVYVWVGGAAVAVVVVLGAVLALRGRGGGGRAPDPAPTSPATPPEGPAALDPANPSKGPE